MLESFSLLDPARVGNALKFTHKGSVTVGVRVVAGEDITMPISTHDGVHSSELGIRAVGPSGTTKFVESPVHPASAPDSMLLEFEVRDTGIGISPEKLVDMFKPVTQADASTSRLYGGTGLGLCIVQSFVELLGGTIWAESETGKGSAFHFRLPFLLNSPKESSSETSPKISTKTYSDKFNGRQPWSLMGGLIFNQPGKYQSSPESGAQARNAHAAAPRGRSADDLLSLWKENNNKGGSTLLDDSDSNDSSSSPGRATRRSRLVRRGSGGPGRDPGTLPWACPERLKGRRNAFITAPSSGGPAHASDEWVSGELLRSDGSASNEVIQLVPKESFSSATVGSAFVKPHEGPTESGTPNGEEAASGVAERERGNVTAAVTAGDGLLGAVAVPGDVVAFVRCDLSRESSAELENMLVSKVSLNILLAEDNAINQKVASRQLEKHGYVVTIVGDGQQALDVMCCRHGDFDLVLMDVQMPVMDGLRATDFIRKAESENGWTRVPILGLTAHAIQGYQDTCLQHGMDGYLGKPFDVHQLLKTIGHLLPPDSLGLHTLSR